MRYGSSGTRGLSPRGRGSHDADDRSVIHDGSIPAWAGEPCPSHCRAMTQGVYPRVGGGARHADALDQRNQGLSPRGRGSLLATIP